MIFLIGGGINFPTIERHINEVFRNQCTNSTDEILKINPIRENELQQTQLEEEKGAILTSDHLRSLGSVANNIKTTKWKSNMSSYVFTHKKLRFLILWL